MRGLLPLVETVLVCLFVGLPLVAVMCLSQTPAWPKILPSADDAMTELAVWHAVHDVQLTGSCSHDCFRNLGPMYFYLLAPLYWLTGCSRASFFVTVGLINLASLVGILVVVRRCADRGAMIWAAFVLTLYVRFLETRSLVSAWPADVQVLPVLFSVILFTAVAAGHLRYLPVAVAVASLPMQTNVTYLPALTVVGLLSLLLVGLPSGRPATSPTWRIIVATAAVTAVIWALPVARELTQPSSDLAHTITYFRQSGPGHTWSESLAVLAEKLAAFPRFCVTGERNPLVDDVRPWITPPAAGIQVLFLLAAFSAARRRTRAFEAALALLALALGAIFAVSIHRIVGPIVFHMVHWMTILSVLVLIAAGGTCIAVSSPLLRRGSWAQWRQVSAFVALAVVLLGCILNFRDAFNEPKRLAVIEADPSMLPELAAASECILDRDEARCCLVRILDHDAWTTAADFVVRLVKGGFVPVVDPEWVMMFGPQHAPPGTPDGTFFVCNPQTRPPTTPSGDWELVAQARDATVYWRRRLVAAEGCYSAADLEFVAERLAGFSRPESDGKTRFRWSDGPESILRITLKPGRACKVVITARPLELPDGPQAMAVLLNGRQLCEIALANATFEAHAFTLPAALVEDCNTLVFRYRYVTSPAAFGQSADRRSLAVCFKDIAFHEIGGSVPLYDGRRRGLMEAMKQRDE